MPQVYRWDDRKGCVPFSTSATGVYTSGSSQSAQDTVCVCGFCGRPMVRKGSIRNVFQHTYPEDEARCGRLQAVSNGSLSSLESPQISIGLRYSGNSLNLYLSFYSLVPGASYPEDAKIVIRSGKSTISHAASLLARNKGTMLRAPVPAAKYQIEYQGFRDGEAKYWPANADGPDPDGAFLDSSFRLLRPGTRIPPDRSKEYYFLTTHPVEEGNISPNLRLSLLCTQAQTKFISWHLYKVSVLRFSADAASFFLHRGIFPSLEKPALVPVWPPCVERQNFLLHHAGSLYFSVSGTDAQLRSYPQKSVYPSTDNASRRAALYRVSGNKADVLVDGGTLTGLGFYWCRQTNLRGVETPPAVSVLDADGNPLEGDAPDLTEDRILTILAPYNGMVRVYHQGVLKLVSELYANQETYLTALPYDAELQIYQGCDLVRTLRFGEAAKTPPKPQKPAKAPEPPAAPANPAEPAKRTDAPAATPAQKPAEVQPPAGAPKAPEEPAASADSATESTSVPAAAAVAKPADSAKPPEAPSIPPAQTAPAAAPVQDTPPVRRQRRARPAPEVPAPGLDFPDFSLLTRSSSLQETVQRMAELKDIAAEEARRLEVPAGLEQPSPQAPRAGRPEGIVEIEEPPMFAVSAGETRAFPVPEVPAIQKPVSAPAGRDLPRKPQTDPDIRLLARLQACAGHTIPVPHAIGACAGLFAPPVQRWIARRVREHTIPEDAYRLLVYESNIRRGGRFHGR